MYFEWRRRLRNTKKTPYSLQVCLQFRVLSGLFISGYGLGLARLYIKIYRLNKNSYFYVFQAVYFTVSKSVRIRSFSGPFFSRIRAEYGEIISPYSARMRVKMDQNGQTPNTDTFHAVVGNKEERKSRFMNFDLSCKFKQSFCSIWRSEKSNIWPTSW